MAIVAHAVYRIGSRALKNAWLWAIAAASFIAIFVLRRSLPSHRPGRGDHWRGRRRLAPQHFRIGASHRAGKPSSHTALIDDDTPIPPHATFRWMRLVSVLVTGLVLWALPIGLVAATAGRDHTLTAMSWFFTKAALLTFGGAYAVLPYVYQGAVTAHGWLTPAQMIDGLALGETTPGPLIMVVAFVGFVGAYGQALFGPDAGFRPAPSRLGWSTWFTFLPSFVFILAGGPLVESTRGDISYTAPLSGITAAVVGVILSLALFFGYHVLWPQGFTAPFDIGSAVLTVAAAVALFRYKWTSCASSSSSRSRALAGLLVTVFAREPQP